MNTPEMELDEFFYYLDGIISRANTLAFNELVSKKKCILLCFGNISRYIWWLHTTSNIVLSGEEPPESLFMKELKRRGMTPTSLLEDYKKSNYGLDEEVYVNEEDRGFPNRNAVSTNVERGLENQRERSMALNSEGLEVDSLSTFLE